MIFGMQVHDHKASGFSNTYFLLLKFKCRQYSLKLKELFMSRLIDATKLLKPGKAYFSNLKNKSNHTNFNKTMCEWDKQ